MQFDGDDLLIRPGQYLWIWFITPSSYQNLPFSFPFLYPSFKKYWFCP